MQSQIDELQQSKAQLQDQNTLLRAQLSTGATNVTSNIPENNHSTAEVEDRLKILQADNYEKDVELEKLKKDQEDLLELLTDQDVKLTSFKNRLRELGETIDDADSDNNSLGSENET